MVVASGMESGSVTTKTVVIFNYHNIEWLPATGTIGIFAAAKESEQCHSFMNGENPNLSDLVLGSNIGETGKWVQVHQQNMECRDLFETECPTVIKFETFVFSAFREIKHSILC